MVFVEDILPLNRWDISSTAILFNTAFRHQPNPRSLTVGMYMVGKLFYSPRSASENPPYGKSQGLCGDLANDHS